MICIFSFNQINYNLIFKFFSNFSTTTHFLIIVWPRNLSSHPLSLLMVFFRQWGIGIYFEILKRYYRIYTYDVFDCYPTSKLYINTNRLTSYRGVKNDNITYYIIEKRNSGAKWSPIGIILYPFRYTVFILFRGETFYYTKEDINYKPQSN